jgi:hypothetical protein
MRTKIESEKVLERKLSEELKRIGGQTIKLLPIYLTGLPDRLCLLTGGRLFFAEIKTTTKKPTKIQLVIHKKLRKLGFSVYVIDSTKQISGIIEKYERERLTSLPRNGD